LHALLGDCPPLSLDHFAGIGYPRAQGVDHSSVAGALLRQRRAMFTYRLEHRLSMSVSGRVEIAPGQGTRRQSRCDRHGDTEADIPNRSSGGSDPSHNANEQDDFGNPLS
jgi:hypothetical protein